MARKWYDFETRSILVSEKEIGKYKVEGIFYDKDVAETYAEDHDIKNYEVVDTRYRVSLEVYEEKKHGSVQDSTGA